MKELKRLKTIEERLENISFGCKTMQVLRILLTIGGIGIAILGVLTTLRGFGLI